MASPQTKIAGTGASATPGTQVWTTPGNITAEDGSNAYASYGAGTVYTQTLYATNFSFSGVIPVGATINGITARIKRYRTGSGSGNYVRDYVVKLLKAGVISGNNKAVLGVNWPTGALANQTYGASNDLWGVTLTRDDVCASNFGFVLQALIYRGSSGTAYAQVDVMELTIYYTEAGGFSGQISGMAVAQVIGLTPIQFDGMS